MTEDDVRRIVREEIERRFPNQAVARPTIPDHWPIYPVQPLPMPKYEFQRSDYYQSPISSTAR